jgi:hypothetical protein
MLSIATTARPAPTKFFQQPGLLTTPQVHHPFLVLDPQGDTQLQVVVETYAPNLLRYPDATMVLAIWPGKSRSDYFGFTVAEIRAYLRPTAETTPRQRVSPRS